MLNQETKKVHRVVAVVYILFMAFIVGGTYLSEQQKASIKANDNKQINLQSVSQ